MAGKFLSLEEAARQLGVTVDDVHRFVDRKKLFPMRDGATIKFKVDDVERLVRDLADEGSQSDALALDLETPAAASAGEPDALDAGDLDLGDALDAGDSLFADGGDAASASHTIVREGAAGGDADAAGSGLSMASVAGTSSADIVFGDSAGDGGADNDDLNLESIVGASSIGASSPSLAAATSGVTGGPGEIDETLAIDLGDAQPAEAGGSLAVGSDAGLAGSPEATGAGLALSGALDSGLSLEEGGLEVSGIDLGGGSAAVAADDGTVLGGDDFELGGGGTDDDSASVVIAEPESGDSSFFGQAMGAESSAFGDESVGLPSSIASEAMGMPGDFAPEMTFSVWQTAGLICCSLLLLFGGFIAYDLVRTIGSPESTTLANPLLNAMADAFGWR